MPIQKRSLLLAAILYLFSSFFSPILAAVTYTYDANGNMTSDGTICYEYNEANHLKVVRRCANNDLIAEYYYDHEGNRKWKKLYQSGVNTKKIFTISDEYELDFTASTSAYKYTTHYYADEKIVAKKNPDGSKNYLHGDHLGSTTLITKQDGTVLENTTYDPFGKVTSGGVNSRFGYTGQEKDPETPLNYYNARYYDSSIRRFAQADDVIQDVYDPQTLNRYSYVRNNPLTYNDPTGHVWQYAAMAGLEAFTFGFAASGFSSGWQYATDTSFTGRLQSGLAGTNDILQTDEGQILTNTLMLGAGFLQPTNLSVGITNVDKNTGGRLGNQATRIQNSKIAQSYVTSGEYEVIGGGGVKPEEYLKPLNGGRTGGSYIDITLKNVSTGNYLRINTADIYKNGGFTQRELINASRIEQQTGTYPILIPKNK
jgi:RHS repeat-associated protein